MPFATQNQIPKTHPPLSHWLGIASRFAWRNLVEDRVRFTVAVIGVVFAAGLMTFQVSLLSSFLRAASRLVDSTDADLWVTARGVKCFDFSATIERRYIELIEASPGVVGVSRACMGFAEFRKRDGSHQTVALVGADETAGPAFPIPAENPEPVLPNALALDVSSRRLLGADELPLDTEVNGFRARVVRQVEGFSSFLGSPYIFGTYRDVSRFLHLGPEQGMYILVKLAPNYDKAEVQRQLQQKYPNVHVWTKEEFAKQSQQYWLAQTGAGATILLSALLGCVIGLVIVSQAIYAATMENIEEFATLRAIGAPSKFIIVAVVEQALIAGIIGSAIAGGAVFPLLSGARSVIPWARTSLTLTALMCIPSITISCVAAFAGTRAAIQVEPGRVFRA